MLDQISVEKSDDAAAITSKDELFAYLLPLLDEEPESDENLIDYGLTSIDLMKLVTALRDHGVEVNFDDLARKLTVDGIWDVIAKAAEKGGDHA